jgi:hypothetical protein
MMSSGEMKTPKLNLLEKGQSLVELGVSLVLLLIILAGIVDLGRAVIVHFILQDAAEEGILYGTSFPTDCNQITMRIRDNLNMGFIKSSVNVAIKIQDDSGNFASCYSIPNAQVYSGKLMQIELKNDFTLTMPFLGTFVGGQVIPIDVQSTGMVLRPPPP